jgi:hypothetical protein
MGNPTAALSSTSPLLQRCPPSKFIRSLQAPSASIIRYPLQRPTRQRRLIQSFPPSFSSTLSPFLKRSLHVGKLCSILLVLSQEFIVQFGDPKIRQFNLIGVDMRSHGGTKGKVPNDFGQEMATEDMARFMVSLKPSLRSPLSSSLIATISD